VSGFLSSIAVAGRHFQSLSVFQYFALDTVQAEKSLWQHFVLDRNLPEYLNLLLCERGRGNMRFRETAEISSSFVLRLAFSALV